MSDCEGNDVMEITALYGTQAVNIKQERDTFAETQAYSSSIRYGHVKQERDTFAVKNEVPTLDDEDFEDDIIRNFSTNTDFEDDIEIHKSIPQNLTWIPLVYTTRLDDMKTFDKIAKFTAKEAASGIQVESKPQYKQILSVKRGPSDLDNFSYMQLCSHIDRLNYKARNEAKTRNDKLMSMCKPLKIVLTDLKWTKNTLYPESDSNKTWNNNLFKQLQLKFYEDGILDSDVITNDASTTYIKTGSTTVVFKDRRTNEADIYIVHASKSLSAYYRINCKESDTIEKSNNVVDFELCCWVNREFQINKLCRHNLVTASVASFMRKPHSCLPGPCTCCCVFDIPKLTKPFKLLTEQTNKKPNIEASSKPDYILQRAVLYTPNVRDSVVKTVAEPKNYMKNTVLLFKNKGIIMSQTGLFGENYEFGSKGNIENHVSHDSKHSIYLEKNLYHKDDKERGQDNGKLRLYINYPICCWYKRNEVVVNLNKRHNVSPRALRYLRIPHICKSGKCICCCRKTKRRLLHQTKDTASDTPSNKKTLVKLAQKKKPLTEKTCKSVAPRNKKSASVVGSNKSIIKDQQSKTMSTVMDTIDPNTTPASLINSILHRFKDLKLSINAQGNFTANIYTPPEQLSTVEIKVLADILSFAAAQVRELNITPEEFCQRVNSRATNLPTSSSTEIPAVQKPLIPSKSSYQESIEQTVLPPLPPDCLISTSSDKLQLCKAKSIDITFPTTKNTSKIAALYATMSNSSSIKNYRLVNAYNNHVAEPPENYSLPKIVNVESLAGKRNSQDAKLDTPQSTESKLRVRSAKELRDHSAQHPQIHTLNPTYLGTPNKDNLNTVESEPGHNINLPAISTSDLTSINKANDHNVPTAFFNGVSMPNAANSVIDGSRANQSLQALTDPSLGTFWAYVNGGLVQLKIGDSSVMPAITTNQMPVLDNNVAFVVNQEPAVVPQTTFIRPNCTPMLTINNGCPMPFNSEPRPSILPTRNKETNTDVSFKGLRALLERNSVPPALVSIKPPKRANSPTVQNHSDGEEKMPRIENVSTLAKEEVEKMDFESSLNPMLKVKDSSVLLSEPSGVIQVIDDHEEEEGIFGV